MAYSYAVIGSGMQGSAGGYFLARWGRANKVIMADLSMERAEKAASLINRLLGSSIAEPRKVDAGQELELVRLMKEVNGVFSATSYELNLAITKAAIAAKTSMVDLGGNTDVTWSQLKLHERAMEAQISIVPDCGLAPGLGNTLAALGISELDECETVQIRCGGLPQNPKPPLDYKLVFSVKGLTNEYFGKANLLRKGEITTVDTFSEIEELEFAAPVGKCEAFVTLGGTSTAPWTFKSKVKNYEYKTVRYPGHYAKMKCMLDLGLLDTEPVTLENGTKVVPRDLFHAVVPAKLSFPEDRDLVVLRTTCIGLKSGKPAKVVYDLMDFHDTSTGFTAMERSTSYPAALVLVHAVSGRAKKGVVPLETAIENKTYVSELVATGLKIQEQWL